MYLAPAVLLADDVVKWSKPIKVSSNPTTMANTHSPTICNWYSNKKSRSAKKAAKKRKQIQKLAQLTLKQYKDITFGKQNNQRLATIQNQRKLSSSMICFTTQLAITTKLVPYQRTVTQNEMQVFQQQKKLVRRRLADLRQRRERQLQESAQTFTPSQERQQQELAQTSTPSQAKPTRKPTVADSFILPSTLQKKRAAAAMTTLDKERPTKKSKPNNDSTSDKGFTGNVNDDDDDDTNTFEELKNTFLQSAYDLIHHPSIDPANRHSVFHDMVATAKVNCFPHQN